MISCSDLARFCLGLARDCESVHADPDRWPFAAALVRMSSTCLPISSGVLPLVKYQSETREAMSRAAREEPPWKISGSGSIGFGFSE